MQSANAETLTGLDLHDYPGAHALLDNAKVPPDVPMRPTVLEAKEDLPETTEDGCISDFDNVGVINCAYGDKSATRTIALAGGSHAEHWITALDLLGQAAPLQGGHLPEDGLPADHRASPAGDGRQPALPQVPHLERTGDEETHRRSSRFRLHHRHPAVEHQGGRRHAGHLYRDLADAVAEQHSDPGDAGHAMAGARGPAVLPRRLPCRRRQRHLVRDQALGCAVPDQSHARTGWHGSRC